MSTKEFEAVADLRTAGRKVMCEVLPGVFPEGEIAEIIHHAGGYAGFTAATAACDAAHEALAG